MIPMIPLLPLLPVANVLHSLTPFKLYASARAAVAGVEVALASSSTPYLFSAPSPSLLDKALATASSTAMYLPLPRLLVADFAAAQFPNLAAHAQAVADAAAATARRRRRQPSHWLGVFTSWTAGVGGKASAGTGAGWHKIAAVAAGVGVGLAHGVGKVWTGWARGRGIVAPEAKRKLKKKPPPAAQKRGVSAWF